MQERHTLTDGATLTLLVLHLLDRGAVRTAQDLTRMRAERGDGPACDAFSVLMTQQPRSVRVEVITSLNLAAARYNRDMQALDDCLACEAF